MVQQGEKYPLHSPSREAESFTGLAVGLYQQHKGEKPAFSSSCSSFLLLLVYRDQACSAVSGVISQSPWGCWEEVSKPSDLINVIKPIKTGFVAAAI